MCTCSDACQYIDHSGIDFSGVGLAGYRIALFESHLLCNHRIDLVDGLLISVKQFQKACLCPGCSLGTEQFHASKYIVQIFEIQTELLHPKRCTFSDGCRLCRLKMGKCQGRLVFVFICKFCQLCQYIDQFLFHQLQCFCHHDNVGIVTNIAGGCSQMDDAFCFRALYAICIHMGHNVVADKTFSFFCHIIIDVLCMCFQFLDLLVCNVQSKLFFCLSKCDPEFSPGTEFHIR